jgi:hypothetical protein
LNSYETTLLEIADIQVGYQARGRIEENLVGDFTIIRPQDFDSAGNLLLDQAMRFSPSSKIDPQKYLITVDDILVQARGQSHMAYLTQESLVNSVAANSFYIIRIIEREKIIPAYLTWWINQPKVQTYFKKERGISTVPFISKSVLSFAPVLIPPLKIQEKIIELIQLWQQEQGLHQHLIQKKDTLIQAVAQNAAARLMEEH